MPITFRAALQRWKMFERAVPNEIAKRNCVDQHRVPAGLMRPQIPKRVEHFVYRPSRSDLYASYMAAAPSTDSLSLSLSVRGSSRHTSSLSKQLSNWTHTVFWNEFGTFKRAPFQIHLDQNLIKSRTLLQRNALNDDGSILLESKSATIYK